MTGRLLQSIGWSKNTRKTREGGLSQKTSFWETRKQNQRPNKDGPRGAPTYNCGLTYTKAKGGSCTFRFPQGAMTKRKKEEREEMTKRTLPDSTVKDLELV